MMFCSYCGSKLFEEDRTCKQCGAPAIGCIILDEKIREEVKNSYSENDRFIPQNNDCSFSFIHGSEQEIIFNINNEINDPSALNGMLYWVLFPYGKDEIILEKHGIIKDGKVIIYLSEEDTDKLRGKFIQKIIFSVNEIKCVNQGVVLIV